jgi:DNA-binding transcriptional LysR family regulator
MDLNEISVFLEVVQSGGFSKAAKKLGMPNSTVSSKISSLEKRLATTLIQRTTRQLKITPAGQSYFELCIKGLQEIQNAEREIVAAQSEPQGLLRITAPIDLGGKVLPPVLSRYLAKFPKVKVELNLTDNITDLIGEKFDLAFRVGKLDDSSLISRKVGLANYALYAAPKYLKIHGQPLQPQDLRKHACLAFQPMGTEEWRLEGKNGNAKVPIEGSLIVNNLSALKNFLLQGDGIAFFPNFMVREELAAKKLVRVLPEWGSKPRPLHILYPAQRHPPPKLSAFLSLAVEMLRDSFE